jgi:hypothetical protein
MNLTETIKAQMDEIKELKALIASQAKAIDQSNRLDKTYNLREVTGTPVMVMIKI